MTSMSILNAQQYHCPGTPGVPPATLIPKINVEFPKDDCSEQKVAAWLKEQCPVCPSVSSSKPPYLQVFPIKAIYSVHVKGADPKYPNGVTKIETEVEVSCVQKGNRPYCTKGVAPGKLSATLTDNNYKIRWEAEVSNQEVKAVQRTPSNEIIKQHLLGNKFTVMDNINLIPNGPIENEAFNSGTNCKYHGETGYTASLCVSNEKISHRIRQLSKKIENGTN
jgi:hypothetical protein